MKLIFASVLCFASTSALPFQAGFTLGQPEQPGALPGLPGIQPQPNNQLPGLPGIQPQPANNLGLPGIQSQPQLGLNGQPLGGLPAPGQPFKKRSIDADDALQYVSLPSSFSPPAFPFSLPVFGGFSNSPVYKIEKLPLATGSTAEPRLKRGLFSGDEPTLPASPSILRATVSLPRAKRGIFSSDASTSILPASVSIPVVTPSVKTV
ncbi:hypothetical protein M3Y97_00209900 [Aphelenchoides bicaudatus]|nr:hypothetical protein M3Y97_00209900 [Aphelenchoides bicaudatus]